MTKLDTGDYIANLKQDVDILSQIGDDDLLLEIPHIEGWTIQSVVGHTGWVFRYIDATLQASPDARPSRSAIAEPPTSETVVDWMASGADALVARLDEVDPDSVHATFVGPQPASWWLRRVTHEAAMHRWDAQSAIGSADPIDTALALDGIDEVLEVFTPSRLQFAILNGAGETVHLHATDEGLDEGAGEWALTYGQEAVEWEHAHTKCDVAARGSASDLLLMLWSRIPPSRLELFGDATLLDRWQEAAKF